MTDAIPAATLIVLRDRVDGPPDILMVERAGAMAFAPGAMVFPGGRVDPADHAFAHALGEANSDDIATPIRTTKGADASSGLDDATRRAAIREASGEAGMPIRSTATHIAATGQPGEEADMPIGSTAMPDPDDTAARIAAIRETIEEAGVPIGLTTMPDAAALATLRRALHDGVPFAAALAAIGATLALDQLVPFARWRPDHRPVRRFDTRFYLAHLPADAPPAQVDRTENVRLCWTGARAMLAEADAGRRTLIFPTRCNLERLARFADHAAAVADARATPVRVVAPWSEWRDGEEYLCIPDDLGYPVTAHPLADVRRG